MAMCTKVLAGVIVLIAVTVSQPITDSQGVMPGLFISAETLKQLQEQGQSNSHSSSNENGQNQGRNLNPPMVTSNLEPQNQENVTPNSIGNRNQQPIISNQQPSLSNQQPALNNQQPTTNRQPAAANQQPIYLSQPSSNNNQPIYLTQPPTNSNPTSNINQPIYLTQPPTNTNTQQPIYVGQQPSNQPILVGPQLSGGVQQPIYLTQQPGLPNQVPILVSPQRAPQQTVLVNQQQPTLSNQQPGVSGQPTYILKNAELATQSGNPTLLAVSTGNQQPTQSATIYAVVPINNQNGGAPPANNGNTYLVQGQPNQVYAVNSG